MRLACWLTCRGERISVVIGRPRSVASIILNTAMLRWYSLQLGLSDWSLATCSISDCGSPLSRRRGGERIGDWRPDLGER